MEEPSSSAIKQETIESKPSTSIKEEATQSTDEKKEHDPLIDAFYSEVRSIQSSKWKRKIN